MSFARLHLVAAIAFVTSCGGSSANAPIAPPATDFPLTGTAVAGMESFDRIIPQLMQQWGIPGGAVAVVKDGRLVYARGYGYADVAARQTVAPDALFRIASVSKPITAVAILKLVEAGKLDLDAKAYPMRPDITPPPNMGVADQRINDVTVRQLLWHSGGWDRTVSFDPMFQSVDVARVVGEPAPASAEAVMRYMLAFPLDFAPGARYAYSNFGYAVLGRIVEVASGQRYEEYVRSAVLVPAGATRARVGRTRDSERLPGEVRYYHLGATASVFPNEGTVAWPYGGFYLEAMDAHGGWVASTIDLLRFLTAVDGSPTRPDILSSSSITAMTARPAGLWAGSAWHYAMGWAVRPTEGNWWHDGSLPGTATLLVRTGTGLAWAAVFNARETAPNSRFQSSIDATLWEAVRGVTAWPTHDLFDAFP